MTDQSEIWAVVLAAGESERMKSPKLALPFGHGTIIGNVICNILKSEIKKIVVVTGAWRNEVVSAIGDLPVMQCVNENYKKGILSSVICGLNSIPPGADAAMIFQGDQPEITPEVINSVIEGWNSSGRGLVIPLYKGKRGHPLLIEKKYFIEVSALDPGTGLRALSSKFSDDVAEVETDNKMILRDIDTKEDYNESINKKI
jgi:molybdenum cofactor cytidylyltransferase